MAFSRVMAMKNTDVQPLDLSSAHFGGKKKLVKN